MYKRKLIRSNLERRTVFKPRQNTCCYPQDKNVLLVLALPSTSRQWRIQKFLKGGLISSFLSSSSPSSSSFLLQKEGGAKGGLHGVFGSRGAGAPLDPLLLPPLHTYILIIIVSHDLLTEQELLQMCLQRKELLSNQDN